MKNTLEAKCVVRAGRYDCTVNGCMKANAAMFAIVLFIIHSDFQLLVISRWYR
jgi:hypothetical protein